MGNEDMDVTAAAHGASPIASRCREEKTVAQLTEERLLALRDMLDAFMGWAQTDEQVAALKRGHRAMPKPTATPKQMAERAWRENPA